MLGYDKTAIAYNIPKPLPDGILITGGEETRSHVATWTILVTLDVPIEEPGMRTRLRHFRELVDSIHRVRKLPISQTGWMQRIKDIEDTMLPGASTDITRMRRGLLNFVGDISNKLFGTATEQEVEECRRYINAVSTSNRHVAHVVNNLVTVVNQTHDQVKQNRAHLQNLEKYMDKAYDFVRVLHRGLDRQQQRLEILTLELRLNQMLTTIETAHNLWLRQLDRYKRQRASLDLGYLTEEILPVIELERIRAAATRLNLQAAPTRWYFEHIHIQPMWEDESKLVFKAELPLIDNISYLRYKLRSWPIPGNATNVWIKLQVPPDVAFHTETGGLFQPTACQGIKPTICRTGALYDRSTFQCPRGILTGETGLRAQCKVSLMRSVREENLVSEISPGTFIISTSGGTFSMLCSGKSEQRILLTPGSYLIPISPNCQMRGQGWVITGIMTKNSQVTISVPVINIPPMELSGLVPAEAVSRHLDNPVWQALGKIEDISLSTLSDNAPDNAIEWTPKEMFRFSWTDLIIIFIIVCTLFCSIYMLHRYKPFSRCKTYTFTQSEKQTPAGEMVPLDDLTGVTVTKDRPDPALTQYPEMPSAWKEITQAE